MSLDPVRLINNEAWLQGHVMFHNGEPCPWGPTNSDGDSDEDRKARGRRQGWLAARDEYVGAEAAEDRPSHADLAREQWEAREEWLDYMCGQPEEW